ncbi:MAG: TldD/PmbA family protein [Candidatus Verstraetearchaeota archaeon]|nr:TldD/PmbA family protein [Candidatus Verstraetearchaeota archaeon]
MNKVYHGMSGELGFDGLAELAQEYGCEHLEAFEFHQVSGEICLRRSSLEVHDSRGSFRAVRVLMKGRWGVASSSTLTIRELLKRAVYQVARYGRKLKKRVKLADRPPVEGRYVLKEGRGFDDKNVVEAQEAMVLVSDALEEKASMVVKHVEGVLTYSLTVRHYLSSDGSDAVEVRPLTDYAFFVATPRGSVSVGSGAAGGLEVFLRSDHEALVAELLRRVKHRVLARPLDPLLRGGKHPVVLGREAAAAFIHEVVGHCLEADVAYSQKLPFMIGMRVAVSELTVYDDPTLPGGYGGYFFDDEGVRARKKALIEGGEVVGLLHTRETAMDYGVEPTGNGRGVFTPPKALMSTLYVKPGSWRFSEVLEETRKGFYVDGVVRAELTGSHVVLVPEEVWLVEAGEIKTPVVVSEIRVPLNRALQLVEAVCNRPLEQRVSLERTLPVSEVAPPLKLSAAQLL